MIKIKQEEIILLEHSIQQPNDKPSEKKLFFKLLIYIFFLLNKLGYQPLTHCHGTHNSQKQT